MDNQVTIKRIEAFALQLLSYQSLKDLKKIIVEETKKITGAEYGAIFLTDKLETEYISDPLLDKILKNKSLIKLDKIKHITTSPHNFLKIDLKDNNIKSYMVIPITHHKEPLALLILFSSKKNYFGENQPEFLNLLSSMISLSLKKELAQKESEKALEMRDRFISLASHELRTPMTSINGYIQLLHSRMSKNAIMEPRWIDALYAESIKLNTLVKEILDINRIKQGQFAFFFGEVNMKQVVQQAINRHKVTSPDYHIAFDNNLEDLDLGVIGDFDKLVEMVSGILSNAIKFSKPESQIIVSLSETNNNIYLHVQDSGKGISKQDLETIFEGFYKSKSPNIEGMGVGLFLAKNIITHHRGKIKVLSKESKGTTVKVTLPRAGS